MRSPCHMFTLYISASIAGVAVQQAIGHRQMLSKCHTVLDSSRSPPSMNASQEVGLWVSVYPKLGTEHKKFQVGEKLKQWKLKWASGLVAGVMGQTNWGDRTFAQGLSTSLIPTVLQTLTESGIVASVHEPINGPVIDMYLGATGEIQSQRRSGVHFLLTIDGIDLGTFKKKKLAQVRDGVINQLLTHLDATPGVNNSEQLSLAEQLEAKGVPNAHVTAHPTASPGGLEVQIVATKAGILSIQVPKALGLAQDSPLVTAFVRKLGIKKTTSEGIFSQFRAILMVEFKKQLKDNGLDAGVSVREGELNGKHEPGSKGGPKLVHIVVNINIKDIEPERFMEMQVAVLRDAVAEQLGGDDESSLEHQLQENNFPSTVFLEKCGWLGPLPPPDSTITRGFRPGVTGCAHCGVQRDDPSKAVAVCNAIW